jgi:hypothetical protein
MPGWLFSIGKTEKEKKMSDQNNVENMLDAIAGVLIKCFVIGIVFMIIWVIMVMGVPDWAWQMHGKLFDLSREQVARVHYAGMLITKVGIFMLFLFPYLGIKLARRKRNS